MRPHTLRGRIADVNGRIRSKLVRWKWRVVKPAFSAAWRIVAPIWPVLAIFIATCLAWNVRLPVPRGEGVFEHADSLTTLLATAAAVLASIVSIAIAVILVAFQMLRTTYSGYSPREILRIGALDRFLTLYLSTIALALFVMTTVGTTIGEKTAVLSYLVGILFLSCLVAVVPLVRKTLYATKIDASRINDLVQAIDAGVVDHWEVINRKSLEFTPTEIEQDPLFILSEMAIRSLREKDRVTPRLVIGTVRNRLLTMLKTAPNTSTDRAREIFKAFLVVLRPTGAQAIEQRDESTVESVVATLGLAQEVAAKNRLSWDSLVEWNESLEEIAVQCANSRLQLALRRTLGWVGRSFEAQLRNNVPPEARVWMLHQDHAGPIQNTDIEEANQWWTVSRTYPGIVTSVIAAAIKARNADGAGAGLFAFGQMTGVVEAIATLGPGQKRSILGFCFHSAARLAIKTVDELGELPLLGLGAFDALRVIQGLQDDQPVAKQRLEYLCLVCFQLAQRRKLDAHLLNELGTIGRGCVGVLGSDARFAEAIVLISDTFAKINDTYGAPRSAAEAIVLKEVRSQIQSLGQWDNHRIGQVPWVEAAVDKATTAVGAIAIPSELELQDTVVWPRQPEGPTLTP
jgi:hypothetical protein